MPERPARRVPTGRQRGQTMAEYAIVTSVVVLAVLAALVALGNPVLLLLEAASDTVGSVA